MSAKMLVVAKEKHLFALQDIIEAARRLGCETKWLYEGERAPYGSIAFYTKAQKGKWARHARRKIMITKSFNECTTFMQLVERVRKVIFPKQSSVEIETLRIREIQRIQSRHSLLPMSE